MNFEPQKFYIGLIDFFSIILPGALLTYLLKDNVGPFFLGKGYFKLASTEGWTVFLFSSYLFGHFIFLLGSYVLDDHVYDRIRNEISKQTRRLAYGEKLSSTVSRWLAERLVKKDADRTINQLIRIKEHYLDPLGASSTINAFQWSKSILKLKHPSALESVERFEADSKFFRSLFIVLFIISIWGFVFGRYAIALGSVPLLGFAFWRYFDRRLKTINQAYWYLITSECQRAEGFRELSRPRADGLSHAGGVVYRRVGDRVEYLLVQAKNSLKDWVLPKGHIEPREQMQETAVREVREETGVWARIISELKPVTFTILTVNNTTVKAQFYLMEALAKGKSTEERKQKWLTFEEALKQATHPETEELLKLAEQKLITIGSS